MSTTSRALRLLITAAIVAAFSVWPADGTAAASLRVTSFTLVDADTGAPVTGYDPMAQNAVLSLASLPARLNVRVNTEDAVGSVRVKKDGGVPRVDNAAPYALVPNADGGYAPWTPAVGWHTAYATAFSLANGRGTAGSTFTLQFRVVKGPIGVTPTPTPQPSVAPTPTPTAGLPTPQPSSSPPLAPSSNNNRCGAMPAAPAGWSRKVTSTFSESTPLGQWPGPVAAEDWRSRPAGYRDSSGRGVYNSAKTISERDGLLDIWIHSEGGTRYVAAPIPKLGDTFGQRISMCMRADRIPGYKIAFLLWPDQGPGNFNGEIDFPEGKLTPTGTAKAFMHYDPKPASGKNQDAFDSGTSTVAWHEYVLEWDPGRADSQTDDQVSFYLDGRLVGRSTGRYVPDGPMHYVMQIETYLAGQPLPPPAEGRVQVDWVTIDVPAATSGGR